MNDRLSLRTAGTKGPCPGAFVSSGKMPFWGLLLGCLVAPEIAKSQASSASDIVVTARRDPATRPQRIIAGEALLAYGAGNIGELLGEILGENGDGREPVTFLVNGRRVTGLADIEGYPAEALERVDVLPRGFGAQVGAPAGARVYDLVLKRETKLLVGRGRARLATEGGAAGVTGEVTVTRIRRPQRINLALLIRRDDALRESERDVVQPEGAPAGLAQSRTLRPLRSGIDLNLSAADRLAPGLDGLLTLRLGESRERSLLGLSTAGLTIERPSSNRSLDLTGQLNAERGSWLMTVEGGYRNAARRTQTQTQGEGSALRTVARTNAGFLDALAFGPLAQLPAGPLVLTVGAEIRRDALRGRNTSGTATRLAQLSREGRIGIDIPLASRSGRLPWIGDLALRGELRRGKAGTSGSLRMEILSLRWSPVAALQLSGAFEQARSAPGVELLAGPVVETSGVRTFDPLRNETVDVVTLTGGLAGLPAQSTTTRLLSADWRPLQRTDLLLSGEYLATRTENVLSLLPSATPLIQSLFPGRFERGPAGRLVGVDARPVVFPRQREEQLRAGLNLGLPLGGGKRAPRLQLAGSVRVMLSSRLRLPTDLGSIDLLARDSVALGGAMRPRHQYDAAVGYAERGLGLRLTAERRSRSFLGGADADDVLSFAPLTSLNLRGFVDGQRLAPGMAWMRGSRLGVSVSNLGNARERVSNERGGVPLAYQPALRDPIGRSIEVELRRSF